MINAYKSFRDLPKLVRILLLLIPILNWITEVVIRWNHAKREGTNFYLALAIIYTFFGQILGFVDLIYNIVYDKLLFME